MISIDDFENVAHCEYKNESYSVRDNGAVLRHPKEGCKKRRLDNIWTFGRPNEKNYLEIAGVSIHRIVATAFHGKPEFDDMVVDHIDTNRHNNRPENLQWKTKIENVLGNPITRAKIERYCGSIDAFLQNPSLMKGASADLSWMHRVSKEEVAYTLRMWHKWVDDNKYGNRHSIKILENVNIGQNKEQVVELQQKENLDFNKKYEYSISELEWADSYEPSPWGEKYDLIKIEEEKRLAEIEKERECESQVISSMSHEEKVALGIEKPDVKSLNNPIAMQRNWNTPSSFFFCPKTIGDNPIKEYADAIEIGKLFSDGVYNNYVIEFTINNSGTYLILKSHLISDEEEYDPNEYHPVGIMEIHVENGKFIHDVYNAEYDEEEYNALYKHAIKRCNEF